jgi:hypothetical protein
MHGGQSKGGFGLSFEGIVVPSNARDLISSAVSMLQADSRFLSPLRNDKEEMQQSHRTLSLL